MRITGEIIVCYAFCVLLGAPVLSKVLPTLGFSIAFVACGGRPVSLVKNRLQVARVCPNEAPENVSENFSDQFGWYSDESQDTIVLSLSWLGCIFAPLDWNVPWQEWPIPSTVILLMARVTLIPLLRWRRAQRRTFKDLALKVH